jgi:D-sedoheptulose 7-phosphate isomerase
MTESTAHIVHEVQESISVKAELGRAAAQQIAEAATAIVASLRVGGKLLAFGNGGSASDAQKWLLNLWADTHVPAGHYR